MQYKFWKLSKYLINSSILEYVSKYAGYAFFTFSLCESKMLFFSIIPIFINSLAATSVNSTSLIFQYLSPSLHVYSNPIHTVFLGSFSIYGDQLLKIWILSNFASGSWTYIQQSGTIFPSVGISVSFFKFNLFTNRPTVIKSLYGKPFAISSISSGTNSPLNPQTKSFTGIVDINISPEIVTFSPFTSHSTETIFPSFIFIFFTLYPFRIFPPFFFILVANVSHNWPGPNFGYQNCSIKDVSVFSLLFIPNNLLNISFIIAFIETPFTLWAPQSAEISEAFLPHSLSV